MDELRLLADRMLAPPRDPLPHAFKMNSQTWMAAKVSLLLAGMKVEPATVQGLFPGMQVIIDGDLPNGRCLVTDAKDEVLKTLELFVKTPA